MVNGSHPEELVSSSLCPAHSQWGYEGLSNEEGRERGEAGVSVVGDQGAEIGRMFLLEEIVKRSSILSIPLLPGGHNDQQCSGQGAAFVAEQSWVTILAPLLLDCATLSKVLTLSRPEQPHLCNGRAVPPQRFTPSRKLHRTPHSTPCPPFWGLALQCLHPAHPPHASTCSKSHVLPRWSLTLPPLCPALPSSLSKLAEDPPAEGDCPNLPPPPNT